MRIELHGVSKGRAERALPETTLAYGTGTASLAIAETEQRPTVLGLLASGRMRPDSGQVLIDGRTDAAAIRRRVALVDAIDVSEPEPNVTVTGVVAEELMFAGSAPTPFAARRWLAGLGLEQLAATPIGNIEPSARVRILLELAVLRRGVEGLVLVSPDRHGGEPAVWWTLAREFADRGYAVLVIAGRASRTALGDLAATAGADAAASTRADADAATEPPEEPTAPPSAPEPAREPQPEPEPEPVPPLEPEPAPEPTPVPLRDPEPAHETAPDAEPQPSSEPAAAPESAVNVEPEHPDTSPATPDEREDHR
jgi:hypothetical protein